MRKLRFRQSSSNAHNLKHYKLEKQIYFALLPRLDRALKGVDRPRRCSVHLGNYFVSELDCPFVFVFAFVGPLSRSTVSSDSTVLG